MRGSKRLGKLEELGVFLDVCGLWERKGEGMGEVRKGGRLERTREGQGKDKGRAREGTREGQGKDKGRTMEGQGKDKGRTREGQGKDKGGQGKDKGRTRAGQGKETGQGHWEGQGEEN